MRKIERDMIAAIKAGGNKLKSLGNTTVQTWPNGSVAVRLHGHYRKPIDSKEWF